MVIKKTYLLIIVLLCLSVKLFSAEAWIRINQLGYLPQSVKRAVFLAKEPADVSFFALHHALTDEIVFQSENPAAKGKFHTFCSTYVLDFSAYDKPGVYYLKAGNAISPPVIINRNVYDGTADYALNYMRQQRCGYNPSLDMTCHQHDGYEVYGDDPQKHKFVDVRGGWHDASDYLQYGTTSSNAVFQMLFAYQQNPNAFDDQFEADGKAGANGVPDILDEAKWGLDWLLKMYPEKEILYHQIADDRDHASFRLPAEDKVDYGWGPGTGRPVYRATGKPQGLFLNKNRSTGIASIAGKYAAAFAMGSDLLKPYYPEYVTTLQQKAEDVFAYGVANPGVCQTAPGKSPYFYEEDNWTDDMQLAASVLYHTTNNNRYLQEAARYGRMEPVTPWMCSDTARHYQWYPFVNAGHYLLSTVGHPQIKKEFTGNMLLGLESMYRRAQSNPFLVGVPFIWCSNNLVVAMATQCRLYRETTGDNRYLEMESALVDWLFGCNPWGTSMIIGLPAKGDYPADPHSALWHNHRIQTWGGLVDGPVYGSIFNRLLGVHLTKEDVYASFQTDWAVYHDDYADYSTNEPTMDGTASLTYILSARQKEGASSLDKHIYVQGGIIRTNPEKKNISLIFSGHEYADGYETILSTLTKQRISASFFFTGDFYRNPDHKSLIQQLKEKGHYLGAHSDQHLLYCAWEKRDSLLVDKATLLQDLKANYAEMSKFGIMPADAPCYLPPFEWYNDSISSWCKEAGIQIVNFTPGTYSNADYTIPDMKNYLSSKDIYKRILTKEKKENLNGNILLFHIGTSAQRKDKFYPHLDKLIKELKKRNYTFTNLNGLIN